jgi:hypothetical protein
MPQAMNDQPLLPRLLPLLLAAGTGAGLVMFAEWCEELLISRRLDQRLQLLHRQHRAGMDVPTVLLNRPPGADSAAHAPPSRSLGIVPIGDAEGPGQIHGAVLHPIYGLRLDVVQWHGFGKKQRLGCLHLNTGEVAVQRRFTDTIPVLCRPVAEAFPPRP